MSRPCAECERLRHENLALQRIILRRAVHSGAVRRLRKGPTRALVVWWLQHPGEHAESDLISAAEREGFVTANAARAVQTVLGRGRGIVFDEIGSGRWRLSPRFVNDALGL